MWQNVKENFNKKLKIESKIKAAKSLGKKPFYFENGTVVVYAKTQPAAVYKYRQSKLEEEKKAKKLIKK
jgi:hypothetical protein